MTKEIEVTEGEGKYLHEAYAALHDDEFDVFFDGKKIISIDATRYENEIITFEEKISDLSTSCFLTVFAQPIFTIKRKQPKPEGY